MRDVLGAGESGGFAEETLHRFTVAQAQRADAQRGRNRGDEGAEIGRGQPGRRDSTGERGRVFVEDVRISLGPLGDHEGGVAAEPADRPDRVSPDEGGRMLRCEG